MELRHGYSKRVRRVCLVIDRGGYWSCFIVYTYSAGVSVVSRVLQSSFLSCAKDSFTSDATQCFKNVMSMGRFEDQCNGTFALNPDLYIGVATMC